MELVITITKANVIAEVNKTSAYIGAKTITQDGENLYYNISTIKEDAEMLERYWNEACSNVAAVAKEYVTAAVTTDTDWTLTLDMPAKYNKAFDGVLKQQVFSYIVRMILYKWLLMCNYDVNALKVYNDECNGLLIGIGDILHARTFTRADDGPTGDNIVGTGEAPDFGDEEEEKTGDNNYGGDMRQNIGPVKVEVLKLRMKN